MNTQKARLSSLTNANPMTSGAWSHEMRHGKTLAIVVCVVLIGTPQIVVSTRDLLEAGVVTHVNAATSQADERVDYFPAQYLNQAQSAQAEEHIQAF